MLSRDPQPPGELLLVSLHARAVVPCWGMASGCGRGAKETPPKKEVCESTSAWNCHRGPGLQR